MQECKNNSYTKQQLDEMKELFDKYCPELNEELQGFAEAIGLEYEKLIYYTMTYLKPGCSLLAMLPKITQNKHVMIAHNYEFSHKLDDFSFCKTKVEGRYSHMGGSVALFGRSEGVNEFGLAVAQTSCGMPVGNVSPMQIACIRKIILCKKEHHIGVLENPYLALL